jgi:hypothetical protein
MENQVEVKNLSLKELAAMVVALQAQVAALESKGKSNESTREMTDDDARNILFGELATTKHKDASAKLGLSYGQIYSCRLGFTFKGIHKEMKEKNLKNAWAK